MQATASLRGETIGFVVEDLLTYPGDRTVLAGRFGNIPVDVAALPSRPGQAVFLLPTPAFRRSVLTARFLGDPARPRATWGDTDTSPRWSAGRARRDPRRRDPSPGRRHRQQQFRLPL